MRHPQELHKSRFLGCLNSPIALTEGSRFPPVLLSRKKLFLAKLAGFSCVTTWSFPGADGHTLDSCPRVDGPRDQVASTEVGERQPSLGCFSEGARAWGH